MKGLPRESDLCALSQLERFLPERIFDAHLHVSHLQTVVDKSCPHWRLNEDAYGYDDYRAFYQALLPSTVFSGGNLIIAPNPALAKEQGDRLLQSLSFLSQELDKHHDCVGEVLVFPNDTEEQIEQRLVHTRIRGLKCYHTFAKRAPTDQADIEDYLPESAWQVAQAHGLCITLHLVKDAALAAPNNLKTLQKQATAYPSVPLILAHCGRGFAPWTVAKGAPLLRSLPNVYFDVSSICEPAAIVTCLREVGVERVLWGSDFPVSSMRGKAIAQDNGFVWLFEGKDSPKMNLVAVEELHAAIQACQALALSREDVDRIFCKNAIRLFNMI